MVDDCSLKIARHSLSGYVASVLQLPPVGSSVYPFVSPSFLIRLSVDLKPYTRHTPLKQRPSFSSRVILFVFASRCRLLFARRHRRFNFSIRIQIPLRDIFYRGVIKKRNLDRLQKFFPVSCSLNLVFSFLFFFLLFCILIQIASKKLALEKYFQPCI